MRETEPTCLRCARPLADGSFCCDRCAAQTAQKLSEIADLAPPCQDVAYGLSRRSQGGGNGKPGSRLPLDLPTMAKLDRVTTELTKWVDRIGAIRGATRPWFTTRDDDHVTTAANWLTTHIEWIRHQADHEPDDDGNTWGADQFLTDVDAALRVLWSIARGPAPQRYLGPCGAEIAVEPCEPTAAGNCTRPGLPECNPLTCATTTTITCDGNVYGRHGTRTGRCRTCGTEVDQDERRAWLDETVRQYDYTAAEIGAAYPIKADLIRQWASRGLLVAHGRSRDGRPLYLLGDVLDLAAGDAARREEARAQRARRKETAA